MRMLLVALVVSSAVVSFTSLVHAQSAPGQIAAFAFEDLPGMNMRGASLNGAPQPTLGKVGAALRFDGVRDSAEVTRVLADTRGSFSVATWVQLDRLDQAQTLVSQDGHEYSAFALSYEPPAAPGAHGGFGVTLGTDDAWYPRMRIGAPFSPMAHVWYHVAAVNDVEHGTVSLYVDGARVSTVQSPGIARGAGGWALARGMEDGLNAHHLAGSLDEVLVADLAWSEREVEEVYARAEAVTPLRPPSVPLAVRSPYLSTWIPSEHAAGTWPTFWTGATKAMTGYLRVDGNTYLLMGAPSPSAPRARQAQLEITATQTRYVFAAGGVNLHLNFISPVEADDIQKQSAPLAFVEAHAVAMDGHRHDASLYFDISGEWAHGDAGTPIVWKHESIGREGLTAFSVQPAKPGVLREHADYASWGEAIFAGTGAKVKWQAGVDTALRQAFAREGTLNNEVDGHMPRPISARWPVFAFVSDFGQVDGHVTPATRFALGHVRQPPASLLDEHVPALWQSYWTSWQAMLADGMADLASGALLTRANALDARLATAATRAGGPRYAALCALVLRQAFGGTELVNTAADPWLFLKEISSNGNFQTVDVIYPSMPAFLYANPELVRYLLTPLFNYAESGHWPQPFPEHDLGVSYPNATAHNDGGGENMPIEESANMIIMTAAYLKRAHSESARAFVTDHYATLTLWTNYLVDNTQDPEYQNQTDDFTGFIGHSSNLALKGIVGIGAMAQMAETLGKTGDARAWRAVAEKYTARWEELSMDRSREHLKLAYDQEGTWSLKYNAFPDKMLGLGLVPDTVLDLEGAWYRRQQGEFGFPLDNRHTYTKADWELWTAAATRDSALRQVFIDKLYDFANQTPSRVPLTDWYDVHTGSQAGFQARPVMGALFGLLLLD